MSPSFPLAGLLRLRRLEQDRAAGHLGAANARFSALAASEGRTRADTELIPSDADTSDAMRAVAAARASSMGMLAELRALVAVAEAERESAQRELGAARAGTVALEKLEARHAAAERAEELAAEQAVLDELGSAARNRLDDGSMLR